MNKMRNKLIIFLAILGIALFAGYGVYAQNGNLHDDIISKIAQKFNLNESDVSAVFEEVHQEHQAQRQIQIEERLTQAVKDGKITETQKQAILKKHEEMMNNKQNFEEFKNLKTEERQQKMQEKRQEMETWANENGLSLQAMHGIMGFGHGYGRGGFWFNAA